MRPFVYRVVAGLLCMFILGTSSLYAYAQQPVMPTPQQRDELYRLSRYDVMNIAILGQPNALGYSSIMVGPDGFVNLPYAGSIKLSGLTIDEATDVLTEKLGEYIKIPGMTLMVTNYGPRKVYVVGEVRNPGIYDLSWDRLNVIAAIASAGGIALKGRTKNLQLVRVVDGEVVTKSFDYKALTRKGDVSQNLLLADGDMIYVPRSGKVDFNTDVMPFVNMYFLYRAATK